ncbi:MAG TPA: stage III sporulation protein AE [Bacillota bacterium]|nr:stage III sporulation protein AE [Bacillota bacterium]HOL08743.1 stage III sporulation protein AE [Bacillota bacterium]HPO96354.1 stage III sporulation protein AE [Bacillota bacterium]
MILKQSMIILPLIFCLMLLFFMAVPASAATVPEQIFETIDLTDLNRYLQTLDEDVLRYLPKLDLKSWGATGPDWDLSSIGKGIIHYILRELIFNLRLLGELLLIAMALVILQNMQHAFETETVNQIAFGLCFLVVMGIVLNSFRVTFGIAAAAITEMTNFMYAIIPLLFSLIAAGGGLVTVSIVHPLLIAAISIAAGAVKSLVLPLIQFAGLLGMVNFLAGGFHIDKLGNLFKKAALGILGLIMALFIGVVTIRGFTASVADSMTLRTAKYFTNTFLPVVGGTLSDTMEMVTGCSLVIKSGLGVFGLGIIILIIIFPLIKILAVATIYHLSSVVIQPLGNQKLADVLQTIGDIFINLFAAVAIVGLMFFIALSVLVGVANMGIR